MTAFLITYDLNKSDKNYEGLHDMIIQISNDTWCRPLKSVYLVQSNLSPETISKKLMSVMDKNDFLLVIEVKNNKDGWLHNDQWDYMKKYIFSNSW